MGSGGRHLEHLRKQSILLIELEDEIPENRISALQLVHYAVIDV